MKSTIHYKRRIFDLIVTVIILLGCSEDEINKEQGIKQDVGKITLHATMPTDQSSTRISLEEIEGSLNLIAKWKAGDKVKLFFVQGNAKAESEESTVFNISQDGKQCSFTISLPQEIDSSAPFDIYAFSGIPGQGVKLIDGNILADISPVKGVSLTDFSAPVWSKSKNIASLSSDIELTFNHLGAYEVIHLKNKDNVTKEISDCSLITEDTETTLWYHARIGNSAPFFNPENNEISRLSATATQSSDPLTIAGESTNTIVSWYVPNGEDIPELSMKVNEEYSLNSKQGKDYAMQVGHAYHAYAVWDYCYGLAITDSKLSICEFVDPLERLQIISDKSFKYTSTNNVEILINFVSAEWPSNYKKYLQITWVDHNYSPTATLYFWGQSSPICYIVSSESLNVKHLKDRLGEGNRTIYYGSLKMTLVSLGPYNPLTGISIYDGSAAHQINVVCGKVVYSRDDAQNTALLDANEPDGETCTYEITETGFDLYNIYNENMPGNKIYERLDLGRLHKNELQRVDDLFDDPRYGHT